MRRVLRKLLGLPRALLGRLVPSRPQRTREEEILVETGYTAEELERIKAEFAREKELVAEVHPITSPRPRLGRAEKAKRILRALLRWLFIPDLRLQPIDRYVFREVTTFFLVGFVGFTIFMIVTQVFILSDKIFGKHIPLFTTLTVLFLYTPSLLIFSIPVAVLFGTVMAIGRLNRDHEVMAMMTSGVSLYRILLPFLVIGVWAAFATFVVTEYVVPKNNKKAGDILTIFFDSQVADFIEPGVVIRAPDLRFFYVEKVDKETGELFNVRVYDYAGQRPAPRIFLAKRAYVENKYLMLEDVRAYESDNISGHYIASAITPGTKIDISRRIDPRSYRIESVSLTTRQLLKRINQQREKLKKYRINPPRWLRFNYNQDVTDYYLKYSIPIACIVFVLVAVPLGLTGPRDERNLGIIVTFILMMLYYTLYFGFRQLGYDGTLSGPWAAWTPVVLYGIVGTILLFRART